VLVIGGNINTLHNPLHGAHLGVHGVDLGGVDVNLPDAEVVVSGGDEAVVAVVEPLGTKGRVLGGRTSTDSVSPRDVPDDDVVVVLSSESEEELGITAEVHGLDLANVLVKPVDEAASGAREPVVTVLDGLLQIPHHDIGFGGAKRVLTGGNVHVILRGHNAGHISSVSLKERLLSGGNVAEDNDGTKGVEDISTTRGVLESIGDLSCGVD